MRNNRKGFTLVEIMIVVAIIALLAVIAIPNLLRARTSANEALMQSTLRTLATAMHNFAADNRNGVFPASGTTGLTALFSAVPKYTNTNFSGTTVSSYNYTLASTADTFTITATPAGGSRAATKTCTIDETGTIGGDCA